MKHILLVLFSIVSLNSFSQVQWVKTFGGASDSGWEEAISIYPYNGQTYITGSIQSDCNYGNSTDTSVGCNDAFLCSLDINGNVNWLRRIGGINITWIDEFQTLHCYEEYAHIIAVDTINHMLYVEGMFTGTISIDGYSVTAENSDIFISKFDFNGNCIWLKRIGGNDFDFPSRSGCFDNSGNLIISGYLDSAGYFDTIPINAGGFLAKIGPDSKNIFVRNIIQNAMAFRIEPYKNNEIIMMIYPRISSTDIYINNQLITLPHWQHTIIAKLDSLGELIDYKIIRMYNSIGDIDVDQSNNIYVSGHFSSSLEVDSVYLTCGTNGDMFVLKLDSNLNALWGRNTYCGVSPQTANANSMSIDKEGNLLTGGYFAGGPACFGNYTAQTNYGSYEFYVTKLNPDGDFIDLYFISNPPDGTSKVYDVGTDSNGDVLICGAYIESINVAGNVYNSNNGTMDCFVARLNPLTGVTETKISRNNELLIYANPTTGKCNITIPEDFQNEQNLTLYIYDSQSRLIQQATVEFTSETYRLNLEAEAKGIYNAVLSNGKKNYKGKIVFE